MQRVAIVTGATGGLGMAITEKFVNQGDFVYMLDLDQSKIDEAINQFAGNVSGFVMDVRNESEVEKAFKRIMDEKNRIDVVINNAGLQHRDKVEDFPLEKWNLLIDVMLTGVFLMTKHAFPYMKEAKYGRIINISSVHGLMATPEKAAYVAAKHGVIGLTDVTGIEGAPFGITVNAVCPGPVKTDLLIKQLDDLNEKEGLSEQEAISRIVYPRQAMNQFIEAEEIADTVIFLASDKAKSITMEHIKVAGGM